MTAIDDKEKSKAQEKKQSPVQVILPIEMNVLFSELKEERIKNFEPTSNVSIVIDAVKYYHKSRIKK